VDPELDAVIDAQLAEIRAAWPQLTVDDALYRRAIAARVASRAGETADRVVRTMPAADLYLAAACAVGDPAAIAAFRDVHGPAIRQVLGRLGAPIATIDETEQRVLVMLFVGEGGGAPQITTFSGRVAERRHPHRSPADGRVARR